MQYFGFDRPSFLSDFFGFWEIDSGDAEGLPSLTFNMTTQVKFVSPQEADINMILPAKAHPYQ